MKVAHLLRKYDVAEWGGTETALFGLCEALQRRAVHSVVYAPRIPASHPSDPLRRLGIRVERFKAWVPIWGMPSEQRRQMTSIGGNLMSFQLFKQLCLEPDLSVIHAHTTGRIGAIGRWVARLRRIPFVVTLHGSVYDLPTSLARGYVANGRGWEWGKLFGMALRSRHLLSEADAVLTGNARAASLIQKRHADQRVIIHPHGVNGRLYAFDRRAEAGEAFPEVHGRDVLLSIGRIDPAKNQLWLLEHLPELIRRHPRLLLVMAGAATDYAYAGALAQRLQQLGLNNHVLLTGGFSPGDPRLVGLTQLAHTVILPSVAETFGLVILEAWASGVPVLASRTAGACSLIDHGKTGLLFDIEDAVNFHAAFDLLWRNESVRQSIAAAARLRAVSFDTDVLGAKIVRLYAELAERTRANQDRRSRRLASTPAPPPLADSLLSSRTPSVTGPSSS